MDRRDPHTGHIDSGYDDTISVTDCSRILPDSKSSALSRPGVRARSGLRVAPGDAHDASLFLACYKPGMKISITLITIALVLMAAAPMAQTTDLEARIDELEAALDLLQERIEQLEQQQTPPRMSAAEAEAVLREKQAADTCTEQLGPAPQFVPVLGTKVSPEFMAYRKKHQACMRDKGVVQ